VLATNTPLVAVEQTAACIWVGSLVCLALVANMARNVLDCPSRVMFFRAIGRRYGIVGTASLVVAIGADLGLAWPLSSWSGTIDATVALAVVLVLATAAGMVQARAMTTVRRRVMRQPRRRRRLPRPTPGPAAGQRATRPRGQPLFGNRELSAVRRFRVFKDFLGLHPPYHWTECRVGTHTSPSASSLRSSKPCWERTLSPQGSWGGWQVGLGREQGRTAKLQSSASACHTRGEDVDNDVGVVRLRRLSVSTTLSR
jgi:hypothetical protein